MKTVLKLRKILKYYEQDCMGKELYYERPKKYLLIWMDNFEIKRMKRDFVIRVILLIHKIYTKNK